MMLNLIKELVRRSGLADVYGPGLDVMPSSAPSVVPRLSVPTPPFYRFTDAAVRIAAIGDLHGRIDLLEKLGPTLDQAACDPARRLIEVYLGDYVDRGANPRAVIDYLHRRCRLQDRTVVCLAGNHEEMLLEALEDDGAFANWLEFGGRSTLISYAVPATGSHLDVPRLRRAFAAAIPPEHIEFLRGLPTSFAHGGFFFAHAGVRPGISLAQQKNRDLLWIRGDFLTSSKHLGAIVVHGHTPTMAPVFRLNRIGIDTAAYQTGNLSCLLVTSEAISIVNTLPYGLAAL